jgi:glucan phosphoethanolaminetransferase (alkaline phosphatase superfamily)
MTASGYTLAQERALAINPKFMASFSMPCSMFIIYEVFCDHQTRGTTPVQRALVGMSLIDILASSGWFMSTWAVPKGSFAFSAGNTTTCNYQGFLLQLAIGAPLYNSSLALFYLLMIKQRWSDQRLIQIERWVHSFILSFTVGTSILLLQLNQYNHIGPVSFQEMCCWWKACIHRLLTHVHLRILGLLGDWRTCRLWS